ncbi:putative tubulin-tyrosine ligase [Trypanosoma rangeli]|uniref:Tubulin--tyrosine ligase-like protein 5 n=1 Tax=Trypanosoma rangeli TaxID=5698 RepID=A0A422NPL9_TRYRA|nr:putative tubulin-tyrosine ligase [Trypanosoma rangeli]RNF07405.1 putative tubulin-tyrosine ligase [Trypanosoma rangeli]|eukprot:RNF07405.1 putative tubulin-tyrosine ligase [Trypanosoma rangeli]
MGKGDEEEHEGAQEWLTGAQRQRNRRLAHGAICFVAPPLRHYDESNGSVWRTTTKICTAVRSAAADVCVTLSVSPFRGRQPTIVFLPLDHPWDGDPHCGDTTAYVEPPPLAWLPPPHTGTRAEVQRDRAYAALGFTISDNAVRFSSVMCALERAGFTEVGLLSKSWSLKWCKRSVRSDFARLQSFQRVNHFPGTWRIGKKDELHKHLVAARERWREEKGEGSFGDFFPEGWVVPEEQEALAQVLRSSKERGQLFIVKPTTSACGRGIYLVQADKGVQLASALRQPNECGERDMRPQRLLVQRYVADALLVEGYKFDLRLYVVVTSYAPLRAYLYGEGLVRFATTPYPTAESADADHAFNLSLTAHLTNFTINKKSEDFVPPDELAVKEGGISASKWTLAALQKHFHMHGLDWNATMAHIHDLLVKTLLAVEPHVILEQKAISDTVGSGCFEVYGVDVLLRRPHSSENPVPMPVLMEVNIMPSLSTHYSLLDQCVKGNFVAEMLTLVGLTAARGSKKRGTAAVTVSQMQEEDRLTFSYGHPFLDTLTDATELEACLTAEEEFVRRMHFQRLCPTSHSYSRYRSLFTPSKSGASRRSLNEVLSLWEQAKLVNPPAYI